MRSGPLLHSTLNTHTLSRPAAANTSAVHRRRVSEFRHTVLFTHKQELVVDSGFQFPPYLADLTMSDKITFSLSALIDKESKKVIFAEADNDLIDILLSFLTLPLGRILMVLNNRQNEKKAPVIGSLTTLYNGLLDSVHRHLKWDSKGDNSLAAEYKLKLRVGYTTPPGMNKIPKDVNKRPRTADLSMDDPFADDRGFTVKSTRFRITDDLKIAPFVPGSILQSLTDVGITETDKAELRTLTLGYYEVIDLLEGSLLSKTPLTDLIFRDERCKRDCFMCLEKISQQVHQEVKEKNPSKSSMTVKAMIQKSTNKILFVEAGCDFVNFISDFLFIPLGCIVRYLGNNTGLHSIDSLYRSISNIDGDKYFNNDYTEIKPMLLKDWSSFRFPNGVRVVKQNTMYNVTDDLTVTPFSITSSFSILSRLKIPLSDVDEVDLVVGPDEGLRILKASLTSTSALTDALMNSTERPGRARNRCVGHETGGSGQSAMLSSLKSQVVEVKSYAILSTPNTLSVECPSAVNTSAVRRRLRRVSGTPSLFMHKVGL
ncbi:hypothetical protein STAS_30745 [Striga asiatica]|uniref:Uncharacterized protein n=1 Tax=Striga asiatica TaxID=4170 RepID=A0A5A7RA55_STRAF|nr:hypothetical protein STAS_30745 [Striga asiatica]